MTYYTRRQVLELLEIDESFLISLEEEQIVVGDAPVGESGDFSDRMLERARVAYNLVQELDVNLAGAAIILRMREQMATLRHRVEELAAELERRTER